MRLICLDTETTGLSPLNGDRIIEIGAVEIQGRAIQKSRFHCYLNPGRPIPQEAVRIHGITDEMVKDKPAFSAIADEFLAFIKGATLVIHNAPFDLSFLAHELRLAGKSGIDEVPVIDTLSFARSRHPNQRNDLDALCDRYAIDRSNRKLHGALLDAELLAELFLAMTGGRQYTLTLDVPIKQARHFIQLPETIASRDERLETATIMRRPPPPLPEEDAAAHDALLQRIHRESGQAIWLLPSKTSQKSDDRTQSVAFQER